MTPVATLTRRGRITIPKEIRERLGIKPGVRVRVSFSMIHNGAIILRVKRKSFTDLAGVLYRKGRKPVATASMSR